MRIRTKLLVAASAQMLSLGFVSRDVRAQPPALPAMPRPTEHNGFLYQPKEGTFWDPTVIYANNKYYMYTMYNRDSVWLATSTDGVHWQDYGVVLKSEGFKNNTIFKQFVNKVGDRYIMNYGAFSDVGSNNNLLRFYESKDLIHWSFLYELPIDTKYYRADGRHDHMFMIPKDDKNPRAGYLGYVVAAPLNRGGVGMMESPDGVHYHAIAPPEMPADFALPVLEDGGIAKIAGKYYLIAGAGSHFGFTGFGVYTYVGDSPMGPFKPDLDAYRLTGTSGIDGNGFISILSAFVKDSPELLVTEPLSLRTTVGTIGEGVWFLPMRRAFVDERGHLRLGYWKQNDLAKGSEIPINAGENTVLFPAGQTSTNALVTTAGAADSITLKTDKDWRAFPWLDRSKSRKAVTVLNQRFDLNQGVIVEGSIRAAPVNARVVNSGNTKAGFYIEGTTGQPGTAILLTVGEPQWRESQIGKLNLDGGWNFESLDRIGRYTAAVSGLDSGKDHTFRLWLRGGQMELYIDDVLMQSFFIQSPSGRIGFISQESDTQISNLKIFQMNLATAH